MKKLVESTKKKDLTPLGAVKRIHSIKAAILFLADSQRQAARVIGIDQSTLSKAMRGKVRLKDWQIERLAFEVARKFRVDTGRDDWGLKYFYNSPLRFEAWGVCRNHHKPVEYRIIRATSSCPKCKRGNK